MTRDAALKRRSSTLLHAFMSFVLSLYFVFPELLLSAEVRCGS